MTDIFISYSRKDQQFVRRLHKSLEENERNAWVDWENIPLTAEWLQEIYDGIEAANAFAYVISPDSVRSEVCSLELAHALTHNKRLIPILHRELVEDMDKHSLDPNISSHNWIFFRETDDYATSFKALMDALNTDLDHLRLHTRLLVRAVQWNDKERDASLVLRGNELREAVQWLEKGAGKQPHPTDLQQDFVHASQRAAAGRRRVVLLTSVYFTVVLILTAFAFWQAVNAENRRQDAEEQKKIAQDQSEIAELNAATAVAAQSTAIFNENQAQAARSTAVFNGDQAQSLALAASAQQALYRDNNAPLSIALALEAVDTDQPPPLARSTLAQAAYSPGARYILTAATSSVARLAVDKNGEHGFWIADNNDLVMTDLATGEEAYRWTGSAGHILSAVAVSPDGLHVATGDEPGEVIIYNIESKQPVVQWATADPDAVIDDRKIFYLEFTPDNTALVTATAFSKIHVRDITSGDIRLTFEKHVPPDDSHILSVSPDGKSVVSGDDGAGTVYWWDIATGEVKQTINADVGPVWAIDFLPDGEHVLIGYNDTTMRQYNLATGEEIQVYRGHSNIVWTIDVSADGTQALTGSYDSTSILWDIATGELLQSYRGHQSAVYGVEFINERQMFSGSADGTVRTWDIVNSAEIRRFPGHTASIWAVRLYTDADGQLLLLSGDRNGAIRIHNADTGELVKSFDFPDADIYSIDINPDQTRILYASNTGYAALLDAATGEVIHQLSVPDSNIRSVAFNATGELAAVAGNGDTGLLLLWDTATGEVIRQFPYDAGLRVWSPHFNRDSTMLLAGATDNSIILWDVATGEKIRQFEGHSGVVYSTIFSPDEKMILSGSEDRSIRLWDTATGNQLRRFDGHLLDVNRVDFSPDGQTIVSGSDDLTVRLWDLASGAEIQRFDGHTNLVLAVVFAPDGHSVFSGSGDATLRQWQIKTLDELIAWIGANRAVPEFTCEQRNLYRIAPFCAS